MNSTEKEHFQRLLDRYLLNKLSAEEMTEFFRLQKTGEYDDLLRDKIDEVLLMQEGEQKIPTERAANILYNILSSEKHTAQVLTLKPKPKIYLLKIATAAAAILVLALGIWFLTPKGRVKDEISESSKKVSSPNAGVAKIQVVNLPDGSIVMLNSGSTLEYDPKFKGGNREVTLKGEGYFDIKHDPSRPFIVHTGSVTTTVLGTAFNIKAPEGEPNIVVTVTRGKVRVSNQGKVLGVLTANKQLAINTTTNNTAQATVNTEQATNWKNQFLVLENVSLENAALIIGNKYNVQVSVNEKIKNCTINATFFYGESLEQVLTVIAEVLNVKYSFLPNDQVVISGEGCN